MDREYKLLVIIVTYNGMKWLERSLGSVVASTVPADLFIVDNGSSDGSAQFIAQNYPQATFIQSRENLGFGAANNIGIKYALQQGYDYLYLLNQDAWVAPDLFELMVEANRKYPQYGILSPIQLYPDWSTMEGGFARSLSRSTKGENNPSKEVMDIKFAMAAHWLISRECFAKVGLFSPIFYHYGEDNNYIHRVNYFGFKVGVVTSAKGVHDRERRDTPLDKQIYLIKNIFLKYSSNINYPFTFAKLFAKMIMYRDARRLSRRHSDGAILETIMSSEFPLLEIAADRKRNKRAYVEE